MLNLKDRNEDAMRQIYRPQAILKTFRIMLPCSLFVTTAFLLATPSAFALTEFQGSLNSVSITDAAETNTPPTAKFTYTLDGDIFTFDAGGSTDSDGTITEYKWDFGDGTTSSESLTNYQPPVDAQKIVVTLTVSDNMGAIQILSETVSLTAPEIVYFSDDMDSIQNDHLPLVGEQTVTVYGTPTLVDGASGKAVDFSSGVFAIPSLTILPLELGKITFDFKANPDTFTKDNYFFYVNSDFYLRAEKTGFRFKFAGRSGVSYQKLTPDSFHTISVEWMQETDGSTHKLIIDGQEIMTSTGQEKTVAFGPTLYIGNYSKVNGINLSGAIDNFTVK